MSEQNLKAARSFYEDAFNNGKLDVIDEVISADCALDDPAMPYLKSGIENIREMVIEHRNAFPDLHFTITDQLAAGDSVMLRWELRGTHLAPLRGLAPTGKAIDFPGMVLMRFVDGKVCDAKVVWHALGMQQQLGLLDTAANTQAGASR
jgi:steroid delta-isomerase-like uncharacterized protein